MVLGDSGVPVGVLKPTRFNGRRRKTMYHSDYLFLMILVLAVNFIAALIP